MTLTFFFLLKRINDLWRGVWRFSGMVKGNMK